MGARFSTPVQTGPGAYQDSCTMGTRSFLGVKSGRRVTLTPHPLLVPWSRKGRAVPLLPLWAVRSVQSLSAYTRVTFTFSLRDISHEGLRIFYCCLLHKITLKTFCSIEMVSGCYGSRRGINIRRTPHNVTLYVNLPPCFET